jgi:hypothetical protein
MFNNNLISKRGSIEEAINEILDKLVQSVVELGHEVIVL